MKKSILFRILSKTKKVNKCLLFTGAIDKCKYGRISSKGKNKSAHREIWLEINGPIKKGLMVCHKCDVPNCVNIKHLFLGTAKDNQIDASLKGRSAKQKIVLTLKDRKDIFNKHKMGYSYSKLSKEYKVSKSILGKIINGGYLYKRGTHDQNKSIRY